MSIRFSPFALNPYLTPFDTVDNTNALTVTTVLDNFDTVIDNLDNFYSSIAKNDNIKRKRFLISRYNLGLSKLRTTEMTSIQMKTKTVPMTSNDLMSVKSILTLQEPVVRFSNITLPSTNIYDKSNLNLHFLNYWQLFRNKTSITTKFVDDLNSSIEFEDNENQYLKRKTEYLLNENNNDPDKFEKFLKNFEVIEKDLISIPSSRGSRYFGPSKMSFFNLLKHSLSIISVFRQTVLIRSALFIVVYILLIKSNASVITAIPLVLLLVMIYSISNLALRENMEEFNNSLKNILDITKIK